MMENPVIGIIKVMMVAKMSLTNMMKVDKKMLNKEQAKIREFGKNWNKNQRQKFANLSAQEIIDQIELEGGKQ